jgi:hypothetical protein
VGERARLCFPIGLRLVGWDALKRCTLQNILMLGRLREEGGVLRYVVGTISRNYLRMPSFPMTVL